MFHSTKMKSISIASILLLKVLLCNAQNSIVGLWYSDDSSRIYELFEKGGVYEAMLHSSKRERDSAGVLVLLNLTYKHRRKMYQGFIRALGDGVMVSVKLRLKNDGEILQLKLRRMFFFPVYLRWTKMKHY